MKKSLFRVIVAAAVLSPAIPANAALINYNEQFDVSSIHYNLNFQANDTGTTIITNFNGTAGTDALTLSPISSPLSPDNGFDPTTIADVGGWNMTRVGGLGFHDTVSGNDFLLSVDRFPSISFLSLSSSAGWSVSVGNYSHFPFSVSSIPLPAAAWLFLSSLIGLLGLKQRR